MQHHDFLTRRFLFYESRLPLPPTRITGRPGQDSRTAGSTRLSLQPTQPLLPSLCINF